MVFNKKPNINVAT